MASREVLTDSITDDNSVATGLKRDAKMYVPTLSLVPTCTSFWTSVLAGKKLDICMLRPFLLQPG